MNITSSIYLFLVAAGGIAATLLLPLPFSRRVKFVAGPAIGIIIETQITLVVSLIFGLHPTAIWLSLFIFVLVVIYLSGFYKNYNTPRLATSCSEAKAMAPPRWKDKCNQLLKLLVQNWPLLFIGLTIGIASIYVFWTKVLYPNDWGLTTGGGGLFGDTGMHSAYTTSLVYQGMPPVNPLFAGKPLIYPFLVNLFSASMVMLGSNLRYAFILPQIIFFFAFLVLLFKIGQKLVGNLAAFFALLIFFLGWGWGFTVYIQDSLASHSWAVTQEYTNNIDGFTLHNVLTGLIYPERSFLPGLVIGLLITSLMLNSIISNKPTTYNLQLTTIGVLLGILPLWHTHTFIFFGVAIGIWFLLSFWQAPVNGARPESPPDRQANGFWSHLRQGQILPRMTEMIKPLLSIYTIAFLLAFPVFIWFGQQVSHGSFVKFTPGWVPAQKNFLYFWLTNSGLVIPLSLIGMWLLHRDAGNKILNIRTGDTGWGIPKKGPLVGFFGGKPVAGPAWFFLPAIIMFIVANLIQFQPWDWDNIKLFSWVLLFLSLLAGTTLAKLFSKSLPIKLIGVICLISLVASGTLSLIPILKQTNGIYSKDGIELAEWIKTHTLPSDVFLIDPWPNHPLWLTGRSAYIGYPGHLWVHGIDYYKREQEVKQVLDGNTEILKNLEIRVDFIVVPTISAVKFTDSPLLQPVYQNNQFTVLKTLLDPK